MLRCWCLENGPAIFGSFRKLAIYITRYLYSLEQSSVVPPSHWLQWVNHLLWIHNDYVQLVSRKGLKMIWCTFMSTNSWLIQSSHSYTFYHIKSSNILWQYQIIKLFSLELWWLHINDHIYVIVLLADAATAGVLIYYCVMWQTHMYGASCDGWHWELA